MMCSGLTYGYVRIADGFCLRGTLHVLFAMVDVFLLLSVTYDRLLSQPTILLSAHPETASHILNYWHRFGGYLLVVCNGRRTDPYCLLL